MHVTRNFSSMEDDSSKRSSEDDDNDDDVNTNKKIGEEGKGRVKELVHTNSKTSLLSVNQEMREMSVEEAIETIGFGW
jgi:hypothetical protein